MTEDYTKHIVREGRVTWCGLPKWSYMWCFQDLTHAEMAVEQGSRLVPCERCLAEAHKAAEPVEGIA